MAPKAVKCYCPIIEKSVSNDASKNKKVESHLNFYCTITTFLISSAMAIFQESNLIPGR